MIFDHYKHDSLKKKTRSGRTKGCSSVQYKVLDSTKIEHLETKDFLSSIETKQELTKYLSGKLSQHLSKDFVIVLNGNVTSNMSDLDENLFNFNHEEADTGIVLHAIDVTKRDPFSELVILCSDTDVLLILLHYFESLCTSTIFKTVNREFVLRKIHCQLSLNVCKALLGFHAITGCDQTGRFLGYTKLSCWETFLLVDDDVLQGFSQLGSSSQLTC